MKNQHDKTQEIFAKGLTERLNNGDIKGFLRALRLQLARNRRITSTAAELNITREGLCKSLQENGSPRFKTILDVLRANGLELRIEPLKEKL